jgi:hypothetical protein
MNSWKFNSTAQTFLRIAISNQLNIPISDIYKTVKSLDSYLNENVIETKDGKKYILVLEEI